MRRLYILFLLGSIVVLTSCSHQVQLFSQYPSVKNYEKLPIRIGLYLHPDVTNYVVKSSMNGLTCFGQTYILNVGNLLAEQIRTAVGSVASGVVMLKGPPTPEVLKTAGVRTAIRADLHFTDVNLSCSRSALFSVSNFYDCEARFRVKVLLHVSDTSGKILCTIPASGRNEGARNVTCSEAGTVLGRMTEAALRQVTDKIILGLGSNAEVRQALSLPPPKQLVNIDSLFAEPPSEQAIELSKDSSLESIGKKKSEYVALYFELGGNGYQLSYSLDVRLFKNIALKLGYGGYSINYPDNVGSVIVSMIHYLFHPFKNENVMLEAGLGATTEITAYYCNNPVLTDPCSRVKGASFFGLRYQPYMGGFTFRLGYTPFFTLHGFQSWYGLSLGYSFF